MDALFAKIDKHLETQKENDQSDSESECENQKNAPDSKFSKRQPHIQVLDFGRKNDDDES